MKLNTAVIIAGITLLLGIGFNQSQLWIPLTVLIAGIIDLFTRRWVASDRLGRAVTLSALLKFSMAFVGFYAMFGQIVCVGLIMWWFIF